MSTRQSTPDDSTLGPRSSVVAKALSDSGEPPTLIADGPAPADAPTAIPAAPTAEPATEDLPRGATIDRYLVLSRLGAGGMGVVYAAYDPELGRNIAIKLLRSTSESAGDPE